MSRQQTIKYLGNASRITIEDIPEEYRSDSKILAFISAFSSYQDKNKILVSKIQEEMFTFLTDCNIGGLIGLYERYSKLFGLTEFYDKLLKPVMYRIGDLWEQEKLDVDRAMALAPRTGPPFTRDRLPADVSSAVTLLRMVRRSAARDVSSTDDDQRVALDLLIFMLNPVLLGAGGWRPH